METIKIPKQRKRLPLLQLIGVAGSLASILGLTVMFVVSPELRRILGCGLQVPVWLFGVSLLILPSVGWLASRRLSRAMIAPTSSSSGTMLNLMPKRISLEDPSSVDVLGSAVLKAPKGTLSTWIYLDRMDTGIRTITQNRYLFASTTHPAPPYRSLRWG